jgi:hypothetical protein
MTSEDDIARTADQLKAALGAGADILVVPDAPALPERRPVWRAKGWLFPLTAAAGVVVIALAALFVTHLTSPASTQSGAQNAAQAPRPEYYMTVSYAASGPNDLHFQVRRTSSGAVTDSMSISAANLGWGGYLTAATGDRAFYFAHYPYCTKAAADTTFDRITITGSGRISGFAPVGVPVHGMVTDFAVSPDGSRMAYNALPPACPTGPGSLPAETGDIQIMDLSTGAVRTWQNTTSAKPARTVIGALSWAPDGRTLVIDEDPSPAGKAQLTIYRLDTASSGGSLQAHSTVLVRPSSNCSPPTSTSTSTCVSEALAGPDGSLTALETKTVGKQQIYLLVVSISSVAGSPPTVLYSELGDAAKPLATGGAEMFADPSGQWVLLWPASSIGSLHQQAVGGWISGGRLHSLPGVAQVFPQGIAW